MGDVESALFQRFTADHHRGQLEIPGVPEVAERILELSANPELSLLELSRMVALDLALAAQVTRTVGSSLKHGGLSRAVKRLGEKKVREIISDYGISAGYQKYSPMVQEQMFTAHRHSVHVAAYSYELARKVSGLNPEHALLCGLLHDVGMLSLLGAADGYADRIGSADALSALVWKLHGMIGGLVLGGWGFDNDFVAIAEEADDWQRDTAAREPDYIDVVLVAQMHSFIGTDRAKKLPPFSEVPAFLKIAGKESGPRFSLDLLQRTCPRILTIESMLSGVGPAPS